MHRSLDAFEADPSGLADLDEPQTRREVFQVWREQGTRPEQSF